MVFSVHMVLMIHRYAQSEARMRKRFKALPPLPKYAAGPAILGSIKPVHLAKIVDFAPTPLNFMCPNGLAITFYPGSQSC